MLMVIKTRKLDMFTVCSNMKLTQFGAFFKKYNISNRKKITSTKFGRNMKDYFD